MINRLKERIKALEAEKKELNHKCEELAGQVYRAHNLQAQVDRQKEEIARLREKLGEQQITVKVTPIDKKRQTSSKRVNPVIELDSTKENAISMIQALEVKMTKKLSEEIESRDPEQVKMSIQAFEQYRASHNIKHQEACLLQMIKDEAQPNSESKTKPKPQSTKLDQRIVKSSNKLEEEKVSLEELSQLSSIFSDNK